MPNINMTFSAKGGSTEARLGRIENFLCTLTDRITFCLNNIDTDNLNSDLNISGASGGEKTSSEMSTEITAINNTISALKTTVEQLNSDIATALKTGSGVIYSGENASVELGLSKIVFVTLTVSTTAEDGTEITEQVSLMLPNENVTVNKSGVSVSVTDGTLMATCETATITEITVISTAERSADNGNYQ